MAERQPTIEQNSHFSAKTRHGQNVEFVATLKFYVSPTGEVMISAPGSSSSSDSYTSSSSSSTQIGAAQSERSTRSTDQGPPPPPPQAEVKVETAPAKVDIKQEVETKESTQTGQLSVEAGAGMSDKGLMRRDDSIDRAFPRGPPSDCPITQFIPDPCRAIDDIQKSIKSILSGFFSGPECPPCPPPQNTDNVRVPSSTFVTPEAVGDQDNTRGNKAESEVMQNEQKYEV